MEESHERCCATLRAERDDLRRRLEESRANATNHAHALTTFKESVRSVFKDLVDNGVMDLSDANDALTDLNLPHLAVRYSATLEITAKVTFESAENENTILDALEGVNVSVEALYGASVALDEFDVDTVEVTGIDVGEY